MKTLPDTPPPDEIPEPVTDAPARDLDWPDFVEFAPYEPEPGERYWRLVKARVGPEDNEMHHIFVMEPHAPAVALEVDHTYEGGSDRFSVALDGADDEPAANVPMWGEGNTYSVRMAGYGTTKSDVVSNLRLPKNTHVVARLWWEFVEAPALSFEEQLLKTAAEQQVIEFNPDAALQQVIFDHGFVPNSPEFRVTRDGVVYVAQRAEHLGSGEVRVYYVEEGDWDNVRYAVRPSGKPLHARSQGDVVSTTLAGLTATVLAANTLLAPYAASLAAIREPVQQCAGEHGLDPIDVAAVVLIESGADAEAVNQYSGATGLMQVMPSDAWRWVPAEKEELRAKYKAWFDWRPTSEELKAPAVNLEWGCKILAGYVECAGGDMKRALYHYSGGETWPSVEHYEETYWQRFEQFREALRQALAV